MCKLKENRLSQTEPRSKRNPIELNPLVELTKRKSAVKDRLQRKNKHFTFISSTHLHSNIDSIRRFKFRIWTLSNRNTCVILTQKIAIYTLMYWIFKWKVSPLITNIKKIHNTFSIYSRLFLISVIKTDSVTTIVTYLDSIYLINYYLDKVYLFKESI